MNPGRTIGLLSLLIGLTISFQSLADTNMITIAYGTDKAQILDLYTPENPTNEAIPVVVLAHGGLWHSGDRSDLATLCTNIVKLSDNTMACASIDYRLSQDLGGVCEGSGKAVYQDQVHDLANAFSHLQKNAKTYQLDPERMFIGGHSAGAHLAQYLNLRWADFAASCKTTENCPALAGAIGLEGIYDIPAWDHYDATIWDGQFACATRKAFGAPGPSPEACVDDYHNERCWDIGSPAYLARNADKFTYTPKADVLLIHSPGDDWVDIKETTAFAAVLKTSFPGTTVQVNTDGSCASGQHNDVLKSTSLARCIIDFARK